MGPHRKLGIYVGYSSLSIIKYLEPLTWNLFTARFADSIFNEDHFPALGGELYQKECQEIDWNAFPSAIHVLQKLNYRFKESLICKILQTIGQMLSLSWMECARKSGGT